ncbi:hypothetical protein K435DRAFT_745865 [Dendrothele bispora CBS 962.96]|uniref:Uncharacterized protein n=1 Tax=Dendrothele bispora (strain CBS 962.96) TaxID=1314807 RepID=A0A4S8MPX4_DENBC|nr:hypothetical protein K435DRAFT_745865 [Dendrothele bispora CBS 962.96]
MSYAGTGDAQLKTYLVRSTTPGPSEKVLKYLDGMSRESVETPQESNVDPDDYNEPMAKTPSRNGIYSPKSQNGQILQDLANSPVSYEQLSAGRPLEDDGDDIGSDVQQRSETPLPVREPGPHDPPGPHYESYGSSFGNMGVLPPEDYPSHNAYGYSTWNPAWTDGSRTETPWNAHPGNVANLTPLPESVASPRVASVAISVESPSSKSRTRFSHAASRSSQRAPSPPTSPKSASRTPSKAPTRVTEPDGRPLSPVSMKSRSSATRKSTTGKGTPYPPLPESRVGDDEYDTLMTPRARSKAPSVAPSDSLSQVYQKRARKEASNVNGSEVPVNEATFSPRSAHQSLQNGNGRAMSPGVAHSQHSRPFSPYKYGPTTADLLESAVRGRAMVIPEEPEKPPSVALSKAPSSKVSTHVSKPPSATPSHRSRQSEVRTVSKAPSKVPSVAASNHTARTQASRREGNATPTPSRVKSPDTEELNQEEARIVEQAIASASASRTPRTSYYTPSALDAEIAQSSFHDMELCILLHQLKNPATHEFVRKVVLKAVKQRMKKLSMKYDNESIKEYQRTHHHNHDPTSLLGEDRSDEPPKWAADLKREILLMQQRIESLGPKIENLIPQQPQSFGDESKFYDAGEDDDDETHTPVTQTVNIHTQATGTMAESLFQPETDIMTEDVPPGHHLDQGDFEEEDGDMTVSGHRGFPATDQTRTPPHYDLTDMRDDSPGQQYLEEELYKLRQRPSEPGAQETTWDVRRSDMEDDEDYDRETAPAVAPTIPGTEVGDYEPNPPPSPPLPPLPNDVARNSVSYDNYQNNLPPWQRIHQKLLDWAIIWRMGELDEALNSTTRGYQVNEVALSIWATQTYKRYVRSRMTDSPQGVVDRLFVPPNMADAISTAVFNGRHGDACRMLRELWGPFGLQGMPRLLVVLAKHRSDEDHWVVHRFSLPDGALTTYDSYPERTLPDGRPLGWWFAIRLAWPNAIYPSPDHLMQKMVRLHRPMQLPIDNSVAAAGIWRNILMGSRAERSLDLERLRDLINTEVKNLRQRKHLGKLSINAPRPAWEDMN